MIGNLNFKNGARLAASTILAAAMAVSATPAKAGSFQVNPVNVMLAPDRAATSLTVKNSDSEPVSIRVITYSWTQKNGEDVYSETSDIITSPPIFTIPAGGTQLVRFGLRNRKTGASYRVILEEIPGGKTSKAGIQIALRLNLPLYVLNKAGEAKVNWAAFREADGTVVIQGQNQGSLHAQVLGISATQAGGAKSELSKQMGVVLPNSARNWTIGSRPNLSVGSPLLLNIRMADREIQTRVTIQSR